MPDQFKPEDFRALTEPLTLEADFAGARMRIELVVESVDTLPAHRLRTAPFSLVLLGPREPALPQATYALRHPHLGPIDLFLVPIARDARGTHYEAMFN